MQILIRCYVIALENATVTVSADFHYDSLRHPRAYQVPHSGSAEVVNQQTGLYTRNRLRPRLPEVAIGKDGSGCLEHFAQRGYQFIVERECSGVSVLGLGRLQDNLPVLQMDLLPSD
jgi:hypothetical protein